MLTLSELADMSSWSRTKLWQRLEREKMEPSKAVLPLKADKLKTKPTGKPNLYTYKGKEHTIAQLANIVGIHKNAMRYRVNNWKFEEAVNEVPRERPDAKKITIMTPEGEKSMTMKQWSVYRDIDLVKISMRKRRGWSYEQALGYEPPPPTKRYGTGKKKRSPTPRTT